MKQIRITGPLLACLLLLLFLGFSGAQQKKTSTQKSGGILPGISQQKTTDGPDFDVEGIGFTQCQCTAKACPCRKGGAPTHGSCEAADFAYIKRGHIGNVKMDGFKAVAVGDLIDVKEDTRYITVYADNKSTPEQREAFGSMMQFMFGPGMPKMSGPPRVVPIEFTESQDKTEYTVTIPGILEEKAVLERDKSGKPVSTVPAVDQWGNTIHYANNVVFKYHDKDLGKEWDLSGRQANIKYFHTTRKMYDNKELLAQHTDGSGSWTPKQKQIIAKTGLKAD